MCVCARARARVRAHACVRASVCLAEAGDGGELGAGGREAEVDGRRRRNGQVDGLSGTRTVRKKMRSDRYSVCHSEA